MVDGLFLFRTGIVRCLAGDGDVMWMTFHHTGIGDTCELGVMQAFDRSCTAIAHTRTKTTNKLIDNLLYGTLVRNTTGNTFRHELLHITDVTLEVTVT